jgi:hypothetical protein
MTQELKEVGLDVGHRRVGRLMRGSGIRVVTTRKYKVTTDSNHHFNIVPNWLDRNFHADRPNQKWAGDISYIWTQEGWLYLAVIIPPFLTGRDCRIHAVILSFCIGVIPPMPMFGRSLLYVHSHRVA